MNDSVDCGGHFEETEVGYLMMADGRYQFIVDRDKRSSTTFSYALLMLMIRELEKR